MRLPAGMKATLWTGAVWPRRVRTSWRMVGYHNFTLVRGWAEGVGLLTRGRIPELHLRAGRGDAFAVGAEGHAHALAVVAQGTEVEMAEALQIKPLEAAQVRIIGMLRHLSLETFQHLCNLGI